MHFRMKWVEKKITGPEVFQLEHKISFVFSFYDALKSIFWDPENLIYIMLNIRLRVFLFHCILS